MAGAKNPSDNPPTSEETSSPPISQKAGSSGSIAPVVSNQNHRKEQSTHAAYQDDLSSEEDESEEDHGSDAYSEGEGGDDADEDHVDPYWWTPHAVLIGLVALGIAGFFGLVPSPEGSRPIEATSHQETTTTQTKASPLQQGAQPTPTINQATQPDMIGAQHLLIMHKDSMRVPAGITRTKEEAKQRATEALAKIKKGADFDTIVKEYSDEPGAKDRTPPGDLGTFGKGRMVAPFENAAFALKPGQVSDIAETPFGYHIIKRIK